jgi:hypothetical protein
MVQGKDAPQEVKMAKAVKKTTTRLARWIKTFRQKRYYDSFE